MPLPARIYEYCTVEGCGKPHYGLGLCSKHHYRFKTHGSTDEPPSRRKPVAAIQCKVPECERLGYSRGSDAKAAGLGRIRRGMCERHYRRWRLYGDPLSGPPTRPRKGERSKGMRNHSWTGSDVGIVGAHHRCRSLWGSASQYSCVTGCGSGAREWAYDGTDPEQKYAEARADTGTWCFYSPWPEFYMPMCRKCHARKDWAILTAELREYRQWKHDTGLTLPDVAVIKSMNISTLKGA